MYLLDKKKIAVVANLVLQSTEKEHWRSNTVVKTAEII